MWKLTWVNHLGEMTMETFYNLGDLIEYMDFVAANIDYENMVGLNIIFIME